MLSARFAAPSDTLGGWQRPFLARLITEETTLFQAPSGYLSTDALARALLESGRAPLWLRLEPDDRDPGSLLLALIESAQQVSPEAGSDTLTRMRAALGPLKGWAPLFSHLAAELAGELPPERAVVFERVHHLSTTYPVLGLFHSAFLEKLPTPFPRLLISGENLPTAIAPACTIGRHDLRIDLGTALVLADDFNSNLSRNCIRQMVKITEGRGDVVAGVLSTCGLLGKSFLEHTVWSAQHTLDLLTLIARAYLEAADTNELQALALALRTGYYHSELNLNALNDPRTLDGPWFQRLNGQWAHVRQAWAAPLSACIHEQRSLPRAALARAVDFLAHHGAAGLSVRLAISERDFSTAARFIAEIADRMMSFGQWNTLEGWLGKIPGDVLHEWPCLLYCQGELAAAHGQTDAARRIFTRSVGFFSARNDHAGACQCLTAESALAARAGDLAGARESARAAQALAQAAGLSWQEAWANWQLACVATLAGRPVEALQYIDPSSNAGAGAAAIELFRKAQALLESQVALDQALQAYHLALHAAEGKRTENDDMLHSLLLSPGDHPEWTLPDREWNCIPLMLKLGLPSPDMEATGEADSPSLFERLVKVFRTLTQKSTGEMDVGDQEGGYDRARNNLASETGTGGPILAATDYPAAPGQQADLPPTSHEGPPVAEVSEPVIAFTQEQAQSGEDANSKPLRRLNVHLLGPFRLSLGDLPLEKRPAGRGLAVLKYLLAHHDREIPKEVLMDIFWPEAGPEAARNNLNVAMFHLRQAFRATADLSVVEFQDGSYRLNPSLALWVDTKDFERRVAAGQQLERAGQPAAAVREYEAAICLYQGDFLMDDPYEGWPVVTREHLRLVYLGVLDRLSHIYFSQSQYLACISLCQRILERDRCREDTHRRLMRCYSRQGQYPLALRQYQECVDALQAELDVGPDPATVEMAERIRRRESV